MDTSDLVTTFDALMDSTHNLSQSIQRQHLPIWLPLNEQDQKSGLKAQVKAGQIFEDVWYQNGQDGRETRSSFGLIAASDEQIALAEHINSLKDRLKLLVNALKKQDKSQWLVIKGELNVRHEALRSTLHYSGLARLHLKQAWRHIPILKQSPSRVGFNWYNSGRSIQKISMDQAQKALEKMSVDSPHIQVQLASLGQLRPGTPLAKVQSLAPVMRANVFFEEGQRIAMNVSLPILFPARQDGKLPQHNEPPLTPPTERQRAVRSDRRIEEAAFLPSIRVHRYLEHES